MRTILYVLLAATVVGLGFWAYHENYKTQDAMAEAEAIQREIGDARARLAVLRAEWAYLNRPDRLRELSGLNFDRLGLLPLEPGQFGDIAAVSYPAMDFTLPEINNPVSVVGTLDPESADQ